MIFFAQFVFYWSVSNTVDSGLGKPLDYSAAYTKNFGSRLYIVITNIPTYQPSSNKYFIDELTTNCQQIDLKRWH